ncbi:MoaD/ThiS family protein [Nocardioides limicola]|uniref:MoaD/ThiS family protein n=1 Tax=Nocardioides limicola TaxID=2803368 RepID=UPI00193AF41D|nr:MoaD/ThiS family protein [Nocardioides sp. DJM-14]
MTDDEHVSPPARDAGEAPTASVTVHYWAAARAATGIAEEQFRVADPVTLADLRGLAADRHPDATAVLRVCSVLIGDRPVSSEDPDLVQVRPGDTVEFLPPFAGG